MTCTWRLPKHGPFPGALTNDYHLMEVALDIIVQAVTGLRWPPTADRVFRLRWKLLTDAPLTDAATLQSAMGRLPPEWWQPVQTYLVAATTSRPSFPVIMTFLESFLPMVRDRPPLLKAATSVLTDALSEAQSPEDLHKIKEMASRMFMDLLRDENSQENPSSVAIYPLLLIQLRALVRLKAFTVAKSLLVFVDKTESTRFPPLSKNSHRVQSAILFFKGQFAVADSKYDTAFKQLGQAWDIVNKYKVPKLQQRVLFYYIPLRALCKKELPSSQLWERFPSLAKVYKGIFDAIWRGDVAGFENELMRSEKVIAKGRMHIAVGSLKRICFACAVARVYLAMERVNRLPINAIDIGISILSDRKYMSSFSLLAKLISENYIKGYIVFDQEMVVLSQKDPFPGIIFSNQWQG